MAKSSNIIRQEFIDFFKSKGHTFVPSAPVIPQNDPTLLFTNAGMNQFKAIFLGDNKDGLKRAANSQKCMRVSGKHNDLEEVGRDHHHHTFFEMLGNWSFGDYYKKEAITWAWELLTGVWGLPKDKLYATVYEHDDEAIEIWKKETDVVHEHIGKFGAKSNFWEMGETGPCGPCSEIHMDMGPGRCINEGVSGHVCEVNGDGCGRYIELWNLVFMQNYRGAGGVLTELPSKNIDTGMGFERIVTVIQNARSNYDTDLFRPIIGRLESLSGTVYDIGPSGTPFRVIADHIRSLVFAITDGAFPSNEGRGYVLRRLLRRAYRFGRELGFSEPFLYTLVPDVLDIMGQAFPEITARRDYCQKVIRSEEERFGQTLEQGIEKFNAMLEAARKKNKTALSGTDVFSLYDTYGFPMDLTRLMAQEKGFTVDELAYEKLMEQQKERGRDAAKKGDSALLTPDGWTTVREGSGTLFVGYDEEKIAVNLATYKEIPRAADVQGFEYLFILDKTPFYAEAGGQVGDRGTLLSVKGIELAVVDTFKWNDAVVHKVSSPVAPSKEDFSSPMMARVHHDNRMATRRNHSATHLLQAAMRKIVGEHIQQSGSRVDHAVLRFDFTHFKALTEKELDAVEQQVNEWVLSDLPVTTVVEDIDKAKNSGAMALFGEKYGEKVRVVSMGTVSKELCGGTHAASTGQIGLFHITSEGGISAGVRRIEAVTGLNSLQTLRSSERIVAELTHMLKVTGDALSKRVSGMLDTLKELEASVSRSSQEKVSGLAAQLMEEAKKNNGKIPYVIKNLGEITKDTFGPLTDAVSDCLKNADCHGFAAVLGAVIDGKAQLFAAAGPGAVKLGVNSGAIVKEAAQKAGGSGGGSPLRAQAGCKFADKLDEALAAARQALTTKAAS
ncbi:MAG TPA: alanine--tRNA ligase [Chitinivibrionales bacterium]